MPPPCAAVTDDKCQPHIDTRRVIGGGPKEFVVNVEGTARIAFVFGSALLEAKETVLEDSQRRLRSIVVLMIHHELRRECGKGCFKGRLRKDRVLAPHLRRELGVDFAHQPVHDTAATLKEALSRVPQFRELVTGYHVLEQKESVATKGRNLLRG